LKVARSIIIGFFLVLGFTSFGVYVSIGIDHRDRNGERYVPTWEQGALPPHDRVKGDARAHLSASETTQRSGVAR
jgi:hypothetical protein